MPRHRPEVRCLFDTPEENRLMRGGRVFGPAGLRSPRSYGYKIVINAFEWAVSFQITILKVLAGHPEGRASLADLRRAVGILISSGPDWADRMKRLAALAPDLDIFSQALVLRDDAGWQITVAGRAFLAILERPVPTTADVDESPELIATPPTAASPAPIRLLVLNRRRPRRRGRADRKRPSAVA